MVFQRQLSSECFPTLIAGEWLRWIHLLVTLEVILKRLLFSERSFTARAGEGPGRFACLVARKVIFQRLLFKETSATLLTRKRLLMDLHVFLQITFPLKTSVTMFTGEPLHCPGLFSSTPSSLPSICLDYFLFCAVVSRSFFSFKRCSPGPPRSP